MTGRGRLWPPAGKGNMSEERRPGIIVVDPYVQSHSRAADRIESVLNRIGVTLTIQQSMQLAGLMGRLPITDEELVCRLMQFVRVDFFGEGRIQPIGVPVMTPAADRLLRAAHDEYAASIGDDRSRRLNAERVVRLVTIGLEQHPTWWDQNVPCNCTFCRVHETSAW